MQSRVENKQQTSLGFTLVELLIVIVVIAILAAISVVVYNGIQNRARDTSMKSDLSSLVKKLEVYKTLNNDSYPPSTTEARSLDMKFSFSPVGTDVLLCTNPTGANQGFVAYGRSKSGQVYMYDTADRKLQEITTSFSGATCDTKGYTSFKNWGSLWVVGG